MTTDETQEMRKRIFLILCVTGFFVIFSTTMSKNPVLKPFATSLGIPAGFWMGFVAAASTIPGIIASLPAASLSDVYGKRKMLLVGGIVFASAPFLYLFVTSWWQLILVRFYHGFATAIFMPVADASIAELFPDKRGVRISLYSSATSVGRSLAPLLGGYILFVTNYNFKILYLSVAMLGLTAFILTSIFLAGRKRTQTPTPDHPKSPLEAQIPAPKYLPIQREKKGQAKKIFKNWGILAKNPRVLLVSLVQACQYYTFGAVEYFFVGYMIDIANIDPLSIGIISSVQIVAMILIKPYMGRISDKYGRRVPIILGCIIEIVTLTMIPFLLNYYMLFALAVIYTAGFASVTASTPALMSDVVEQNLVGTSMGFLSTLMDVGQTFGPIVSGLLLATALAYYGVFEGLALVILASCLVFFFSNLAKKSPNRHFNKEDDRGSH